MSLLDRLAYAVASAAFRAWFDELRRHQSAEFERATDEDDRNADRMRDAVRNALHGVREERPGGPRPDDPAPDL